jgi:serine/threonine protein kinase
VRRDRRTAPLYATEVFSWGSEFLSEGGLTEALTPSELLRRQAAKLSACDDASLVKAIETGVANDQAYLSMEYLPGPTLRELLCHGRAGVQILIEVLEGLHRLERNSHFGHHGDLKPENIIVTAGGAKMIDPGDFLDSFDRARANCVTTSAYYPLLRPIDSMAFGAMLWEVVLGCQPFTRWVDPNPDIGPRLANFSGIPIHPAYRCPYFHGTWMLHSVRRPKSIIFGIPEELEALLLRAINLELDAERRIEWIADISALNIDGETVNGPDKELNRYSTLHEDLLTYYNELEDLRKAT